MTIKERLSNIGRAISGKPSPVKEVVREIEKAQKDALGGYIDFYQKGLSDAQTVSAKVLQANKGWVYRNTDVIAHEVSQIEFELFNVRVVGGEINYTPILQHPLLDALDRFNEFTSASDGFYITSSHKTLSGDAFWYVDGNGVTIRGLYPLQPDKVKITFKKVAGNMGVIDKYEFRDTINGKPINVDYDPDEIIHFRSPNPNNPYRGMGKVEAAAMDIDTDNLAIEANRKLFERGMIASIMLTTPNRLTDEQLKQIEAQMRAKYQGIDNAFRIPVFGGDLKPSPIQLTNKEMEFIAQQEWTRDKIAAIFGNNKAVIGVTDDVNRSNSESTILHWKRTTVRGEMKQITDTLNEFLVPRFGDNIILGFKDPVPEDDIADAEQIKVLRESGVITQNEARDMIGIQASPEPEADMLNKPIPAPLQPVEPDVPKSLRWINRKRILRRDNYYKQVDAYLAAKQIARPIAERLVKSRRTKTDVTETREHEAFTNDKIWDYYNKQIHIVETQEEVFRQKVERFILRLVDKALEAVPAEAALMQQKQLLN